MAAKFKIQFQHDSMDCGAACLSMICRHYGRYMTMAAIRNVCGNSKNGLSLLNINRAAQSLGFDTAAVSLSFTTLITEAHLPCIVHWIGQHFVVLYKIDSQYCYTADPAIGRVRYSHKEFKAKWTSDANGAGFVLLLKPNNTFTSSSSSPDFLSDSRHLFAKFFRPHFKAFIVIAATLLIGCGINLVLPFLTQAVVDKGIRGRSISILWIILLSQLTLALGFTLCTLIQNRITLKVGSLVNIEMVESFLGKIISLPFRFFDGRRSGDILQRIVDISRIESFFMSSALNIIVAFLTLIVYAVVLVYYGWIYFVIFLLSSILYLGYISTFIRRKKIIDYSLFNTARQNQDEIIQCVDGMLEIKLNVCKDYRIGKWHKIRTELMSLTLKNLNLSQREQIGSQLILRSSDMIAIFFCATAVINGSLTLGSMLAIQYILGGLRTPVDNLAAYISQIQQTINSVERAMNVYGQNPEQNRVECNNVPIKFNHEINFEKVSFSYNTTDNESTPTINDLSFSIPSGKTTAIVGASGSGKTTIVKLLTGIYRPDHGVITVDGVKLNQINLDIWRNCVGTVLQDGYIFSDTVAQNIAPAHTPINMEAVRQAARMACIDDFITSLPLGYNTIIGSDGIGLSSGQKQRLLIARAIYKNPLIAIFDEATNSLDATNEYNIYTNLRRYLSSRTTLIIAHRLSTVRNADKIIVIDKGRIVEEGNHEELITYKGAYYKLVYDQLSLDK